MHTYTIEDLQAALSRAGIEPGGVVMIHSSLFALGRPSGTAPVDLPAALFEALRELLGDDATLVVPTFTFAFCQGRLFDPQVTPSEGMGAFSEHLRKRPESHRSPHPIQSLAASGPLAKTLTSRDTLSAFAPGGPFDALVHLNAQLLCLGCGFEALSLVHWAEEAQAVPYRYWKNFTGPYRQGSKSSIRTYRMFARDRTLNPRVHLAPIARRLSEENRLRSIPFGASTIDACRAVDFADAALSLLRLDGCALLESPPSQRQRSPS